jgi:hypothetical protein
MRAISTLITTALLFQNAGCADPRPRAPAAAYSPSQVQTREATPEEGAFYAEREKQSTDLEKFTGGRNEVVTVLVVVLLVVLILYLLKVIH